MSANGIAHLATKQDKQVAKLNLAQTNRQTAGTKFRPLNIYDITRLPTQYVGNTVTPNSHPTGLLLGRPWHS